MQWECEACGTVQPSNRSECDTCGHTVFRQHRGEGADLGQGPSDSSWDDVPSVSEMRSRQDFNYTRWLLLGLVLLIIVVTIGVVVL